MPTAEPRVAGLARAVSLAATLVCGSVYAGDALELSAEQAARLGIELAPAVPAGGGGVLRRLPARVVVPPQQSHLIAAPVAGLLTQLRVATGQTVRRNEVLLRIASTSVAELRRSLAQAGIQARQAERIAQRDRQLHDEGLIAEARLRASEAARDEARLALAERQAALRLTGATPGEPGAQDEVVVRAPVDGIVMAVTASPGSRVEAGTALVRVAGDGASWLEVEMPLHPAPQAAADAWLTVDGVARRARGLGFAPEVSAPSQTLAWRARVLPVAGAPALRPGQFVTVDVELDGRDEGGSRRGEALWRVPVSAIVRIGEQSLVFVRTAEGFRRVPVSPRQVGAAEALVAAPLSAEDRIAVAGAASLKAIALR